MSGKALSAREFRRLLPAGFKPGIPIAIALSGGADSIALASLLRNELKNPKELYAFTVDHKLRPESSIEAQTIHKYCKSLGLHHEILNIPQLSLTGIEKNARIARYTAITQACLNLGITELYLGHHADDQAETVLMRIIQGSGWRGLAGMQIVSNNPISRSMLDASRVKIFRPLLSVTKARLLATCQERQLKWHEDVSNYDTALTPRNAIRCAQRFPENLPAALRPIALVQLSLEMQQALAKENRMVKALRFACHAALCRRTASITFQISHLVSSISPPSPSVQKSFLESLAKVIAPVASIDRGTIETVQQLLQEHLCDTSNSLQCTAAGLLWRVSEGTCHIQRQPFGRAEVPLADQHDQIGASESCIRWDRRFWLSFNYPCHRIEVRALQKEDISTIKRMAQNLSMQRSINKFLSVAKGHVRFTLPMLVDSVSKQILAIPSAGIVFDSKLQCSQRLVGEHFW